MFVTFGERLFGIVDRVPGRFYVATPFLHVCEVPLIPGRSYLVVEGCQIDSMIIRKGVFAHYSIYWSLKSITTAWFHALLGILSIVAVILASLTCFAYFWDTQNPQDLHICLAATASLLLFWVAYLISRRFTIASPQRLTKMARRLEKKYPKAALIVQAYLEEIGGDSLTGENE